MPLRDHFQPPLTRRHSWQGLLAGLPAMIVIELNNFLPPEYAAEPRVYLGNPTTSDTDPPDLDVYAVLVNDVTDGTRRLVAAVEIVSPANKDRPQSRQAFVAKCAALLQAGVSVVIVDVVTDRHFNLYHDLLEFTGQPPAADPPLLYATACRTRERPQRPRLETWEHRLEIGQPLPTVPLWLTEDLAVPLDLETTYETTCRALRIA